MGNKPAASEASGRSHESKSVAAATTPVLPLFSLTIVDSGNGWEKSCYDVLHACAVELLCTVPAELNLTLRPVVVVNGKGPQVLSKDSVGHPVTPAVSLIALSFRSTYYQQAVYQFSHELVHTWQAHSHVAVDTQKFGKQHTWVIETMCEAASQYVLQAMGASSRFGRGYFAEYLAGHIKDSFKEAKFEQNTDIGVWLRAQTRELANADFDHGVIDAKSRAACTVLANKVALPLIKKHPKGFASMCFVNHATGTELRDFFASWQSKCAHIKELGAFVGDLGAEVQRLFEGRA